MPSNFKRFCVLVFIAIIAFSCEKDDSNIQDNSITSQPKEKAYTVKKITLNEVKANSIIKNSLDNLEDFDVNGVLTDPLINTYEHYKATVIENSTICE
jgi:hypothetical protein